MRRRIEKRFEKLLEADYSIELSNRKLSTSAATDFSEIESATNHLNTELHKLNEYKRVINIQDNAIADIKMRIDEKDREITLYKKQIRLHKKSIAKQSAKLEADLGIPLDDQRFNYAKRIKNEIVLKCAQFTMEHQMSNIATINRRRMFTLQDNHLCVIKASQAESERVAWNLVGQKSGSNLAKWSELFGI